MKTLLSLLGAGLLIASSASAADIKPALVYNLGGKFDKSFNEAAFQGAEMFYKETGIAYRDFEPINETQLEQAHRRFSERGFDTIIAVSFAQGPAVEKTAKEYKDVNFSIVDSVVDLPNVQSIVFKEQEGSFLVGALAAMASETGKVGFVGGMDIPLIRRFACGYEQGAKYINPEMEVVQNMTGDTPAAWNDPGRGAELARSQFDRGVDVVYAAAGGTGLGVYQAAKDSGKLAIGVDSNQNHLHPGTMLTSMVKRVDIAVYDSLQAAQRDTWKAGITVLGLEEGGVGWAYDEHNKDLVTAAMKSRMDQIRDDIIAGKIPVHDYMADSTCTY